MISIGAVEALSSYKGDQTSANPEFVHLVAEKNVRLSMDDIRKRSPILKEMEDQGQIKIVGALYDMNSGAVEFLD
jgi:carbonic anhydrase